MISKVITYNTSDYEQMVQLRYDVLRKPLNLEFTSIELAKDENAILLGCFEEELIKSCALLIPLSVTAIQLKQMATSSAIQRMGWGSALVRFAEETALSMGYQKIILHARQVAIPFYLKNRYECFEEPFTEVGIPHIKMQKIIKV